MRITGSVKFAAAGLALIVGIWLAWQGYAKFRLAQFEMIDIPPGQSVSLVAVDPGSGYRIIVSNDIASLAEVTGDFTAPTERDEGAADVVSQRRLPIREFIQSLQGDEEALGGLVAYLNEELDPQRLPPTEIVWRAEDITKAIEGDQDLREKLEFDLQVRLDGRPIGRLDLQRMMNGIVLDLPVPVQVPVGDEVREMIARVKEPFDSQFAAEFQNAVGEMLDPSEAVLISTYRLVAGRYESGERVYEDVARSLQGRIDEQRLKRFATNPQRVLQRARILVTDVHIEGATASKSEGQDGMVFTDVSIRLTDEGRMRLWKYSHNNRGFQLLLIVDGIAIAAPRIRTELPERRVTVRRVPSEELADAAVSIMNQLRTGLTE